MNQKGGCGKTTTAISLAGVFASRGLRTLLVDLDPQSHCAAGLAIPEQRVEVQIGDAMVATHDSPIDPARLIWRVSRNLDLAPSTIRLAELEAPRGPLFDRADATRRLLAAIEPFKDQYQLCLIDCSPSVGLLTYNALVAADEVIIPVETGFFSLQGASKQLNTIKALGKRLGSSPEPRLFATIHHPDSALSSDLLEELRRRFPGRVAPVVIRYDTALREAATFGQPISEYAPDSPGAGDYRNLADWLDNEWANPTDLTQSFDIINTPQINTRPLAATQTQASSTTTTQAQQHHNKPATTSTSIADAVLAAAQVAADARHRIAHGPDSQPTQLKQHSTTNPNQPSTNRAADILARARVLAKTPPSSQPATTIAPPQHAQHAAQTTIVETTPTPSHATAHHSTATAPATIVVETPRPPSADTNASVSRVFGVSQTARGVLFVQPAAVGRFVAIAGDFNGWEPAVTPMKLNPQVGVFEALVDLPPGEHQYRLVVDGRWICDPHNPRVTPNPYGELNSVAARTKRPVQ